MVKSATIYQAHTQYALFLVISRILQGCYHQPRLAEEEMGLSTEDKQVAQDFALYFF